MVSSFVCVRALGLVCVLAFGIIFCSSILSCLCSEFCPFQELYDGISLSQSFLVVVLAIEPMALHIVGKGCSTGHITSPEFCFMPFADISFSVSTFRFPERYYISGKAT